SMINSKERESIIRFLKDLRFEIIGDFGYEEAIITIGGVDVKEIDSNTMESKIVKGLYFAGEVMDLDADTGGYNLQIAFSTGYLAAKTISEK
ncbi:MAG: NAD(P)/FAD-dependent oxidoreductase, partial [Bacteroidales bacterium]|nr:NAD(P)/FAD-dependent oxidoreductase [Bacteroidales bacterium]